ncbi:interleukin-21 receptor-like isoform X1 [Sinocyclocheilus grahami]|uniref:Interleukin-21 receptor-like n=2 Tax=Sinocyclocheilus grahami TaxID=75366 RepID=A0A672QV56_SINGR|nr:PREDICTED: interleukin-21 receptor-like isoform X1 [Sinocyclocheilus grahami]XP_016087071.1 PREDICTED: interleukin-21 receptor-like isoform X1 [Sinocyclocheilus grahami]
MGIISSLHVDCTMHLSRADRRFFPCSSMMALWQAIALLVICGLIECNDGVCSVTCTTDFISMLNCSNSDSAGAASCHVVADCRDEFLPVNGSCTIKAPQSWCTMEPEDMDMIMSFYTNCSIIVTQMAKQGNMETPTKSHSENIVLYKSVKPEQPFNLTITKIDGDFNLTWDVAYTEHFLIKKLYYRVRLQTKSDPDKMPQIYTLQQNQQSMVLISEKLLPGRQYVAEVQVAVHPSTFTSMWSEWSNSVEWTSDSPPSEQCYFLLLVLPVVMVVLLVYSGKLGGIKKLSLWQHIPSPHEYFTPLYHTYQGDFKRWVGPVLTFNRFDVLEKSTTLQVLCEKQQNESSEEPANRTGERDFGPAGQNSSKLYFLGSNSQGLAHSSDHISMDTVTVSGQEGVMADWSGDGHRRSLEDFLNGKDANQRAAEMDDRQPLVPDGRRSLQGSDFDDWHLQEHDLENIEQVSLDSYSSNEQSDDGYPQMGLDLDTIDSGFLESDCSSPSAFDGNEQIETSSLDGVGRSHSNYVKQWVAFTSVQVDAHSNGK